MSKFSLPLFSFRNPQVLGFILYFLAGFADGLMVPFFPLWAQHTAAIPVGLIGLLFGCYAGGELIAAPFIGGIADRIGRRPVLVLSATGVGLGFIALYFAHGVIEAAWVLVVIGIFESVLHPTIYTLIADVTPASEHRHQFSIARVCSYAGGIAGPLLGAVIVQSSLGDVFMASGIALLCGAVLLILCLPETREHGDEPDDEEEDEGFAALMPVFRDRRLAILLFWTLLLGVSGSWVEAILPLYAHNQLGMSNTDVGLLFTFGAVLNTFGQITLTKMFSRRSPLFIVLSAGLTLILAFGVLLTSPHILALVVAVCFYSLSQMMVGPLMPAAVNQLAPVRLRATYMAALSVVSDLRDSVGPATGTALFAVAFSLPWMIGIPVVAIAALGLGISLSSRRKSSVQTSE
ncbi:MFS transporter [Rahnella sp. PD12R]|uniref:MFS transporter n=1 Tax=Rahnella sp. PD12R TaxID=2855688 RepID=UPI001C48871B|nr:MFS transporter [Rahnella sp. PD12R]MBV6818047.1 MFS transporter [Rahnella sp. PD12R]